METTGSNRGAWRRGPLPGALTRSRVALMNAAWSVEEDARRAPRNLTSSAAATDATPEASIEIRQGGCLCGAIRYEVRGAPQVVGICHCADCRKASGGASLHFGDWPREAFSYSGHLASHAGRSFCPTCGGRVVHLGADRAEVNLGSLDAPPTDLVPTMELWIVRREPWVAPVAGAAQYERDVGSQETRHDFAAE